MIRPPFKLILAYIRGVTFHPTSGDIGEALGIKDGELVPILHEMLKRKMVKRGGRGKDGHRNGGYYMPEEEIKYNGVDSYPLSNLKGYTK